MKKNLTEIVYILDRSGSMSGMEADTIGGFNSFIERQRAADGDAIVSVVLFDDRSEVLLDRVPIDEVRTMTPDDYWVRGCTALLDAVGGAVHHIRTVHRYIREEDRPEKTIFVITTDGMENASREYSLGHVKRVIGEAKDSGWEFLFLGANIDAVSVAGSIGIAPDRAVRYKASRRGTRRNFDAVAEAVCDMRACGSIDSDWAAPIRAIEENDD